MLIVDRCVSFGGCALCVVVCVVFVRDVSRVEFLLSVVGSRLLCVLSALCVC